MFTRLFTLPLKTTSWYSGLLWHAKRFTSFIALLLFQACCGCWLPRLPKTTGSAPSSSSYFSRTVPMLSDLMSHLCVHCCQQYFWQQEILNLATWYENFTYLYIFISPLICVMWDVVQFCGYSVSVSLESEHSECIKLSFEVDGSCFASLPWPHWFI